jgi:hypothetical protein
MRHLVFALVFAAGCYGESIHAPDDPPEKAGNEGTEITVDSTLVDRLKISELDTEKVRPIAKTIEWPGVSTEVGTTYRGDAAVVDQIFRDDADNSYGVRVRLKNTTQQVLKLEYVIRFYSRDGGRIASWGGGIGQSERWQGFVIDPLRHTVIADSAKVLGAEGFRLYIRGAGANEEGIPDDPSKKEERAQQRAAAQAGAAK